MSTELLFGLFLQLAAVGLVLSRVRRRRLGYTGILFVLMSFIYHGLTEIAQVMFPGLNHYRTMVSQEYIDRWMLIISSAILVFAVVYFLRLRPVSKREQVSPSPTRLGLVDWRRGIAIVLALQVFLFLITARFNLGYWGGLITEMLPAFTILSLLELLYAKQGRYLIPVLVLQAGLGALSGARAAILFAVLTLLAVLVRYGVSIRWRSLLLPGVIGLVFMLAISGMRAVIGRSAFSAQTNEERIQSLWTGMEYLLKNGLSSDILHNFAYRFDGNSYSGLVMASYQDGAKPAGWTPLLNNFLLAVPSFVNPKKLEAELLKLNEENYLVDHFRLPAYWVNEQTGEITGDFIDYIPTTWGILFGAFGSTGIWIVAAMLGWLYAAADNWIQRSKSLFAVLCGIGLTATTVGIEIGVRNYVLTFRAILALFLVLFLLRQFALAFRALAIGISSERITNSPVRDRMSG